MSNYILLTIDFKSYNTKEKCMAKTNSTNTNSARESKRHCLKIFCSLCRIQFRYEPKSLQVFAKGFITTKRKVVYLLS